ncbi:MAG: GHKL domain-containing protein [Clostridia bacterium]|nr:GHKL domain-containing protein [Clostridia bacterium]
MLQTIWYHAVGLFWFCLYLLPESFVLYEVTRRLLNEEHKPGRLLPCILFMMGNYVCNRLIIFYANGWNVLSSLVWYPLMLYVVFEKRGWDLLLSILKIMLFMVVFELSCALLINVAGLFGIPQDIFLLTTVDTLHNHTMELASGLLNLLGLLPMLAVLVLIDALRKRKTLPPETRRRRWLYARCILRGILLVASAFTVFSLPQFIFGPNSFSITTKNPAYLVLVAAVAVMLGVAVSYMVQDIRYIWQMQRLYTMEQQQAISRSLLQNLRYFRHNMVNMLYGLEGELIGGDRKTVTAYYQQMREKCMLVNNENIAALERITNPSVGAVLLRGVDKARQLNLPMNLYVQENVHFGRTLPEADLCQVLGVLQDNAIEAADKAEERFVSVEIRAVESGVEIIVKNTYIGDVSPEQLTRGGVSTKEGHEGQGLSSCYQILSRRKGAFLNFWVTGQYVQAQLLLSR